MELNYEVIKKDGMCYSDIFNEFCNKNEISFCLRVLLGKIAEICDYADSEKKVIEINAQELSCLDAFNKKHYMDFVNEIEQVALMLSGIIIKDDISTDKLFTQFDIYMTSLVLFRGFIPRRNRNWSNG